MYFIQNYIYIIFFPNIAYFTITPIRVCVLISNMSSLSGIETEVIWEIPLFVNTVCILTNDQIRSLTFISTMEFNKIKNGKLLKDFRVFTIFIYSYF